MADAVKVAQRAAKDIESWLRGLEITVWVKNVENVPAYQRRDVDIIWKTKKDTYKIEIKGDLWHKSGNFFFETHSNKEKGTPGCFIYTEADLVFYYFLSPRTLYILPMPETRRWFLANLNGFKTRHTTTPIPGGYYTTVGRLVPIKDLIREVSGVKIVQI
jgi:hypothetical protein